jgi:hypothetical protein
VSARPNAAATDSNDAAATRFHIVTVQHVNGLAGFLFLDVAADDDDDDDAAVPANT